MLRIKGTQRELRSGRNELNWLRSFRNGVIELSTALSQSRLTLQEIERTFRGCTCRKWETPKPAQDVTSNCSPSLSSLRSCPTPWRSSLFCFMPRFELMHGSSRRSSGFAPLGASKHLLGTGLPCPTSNHTLAKLPKLSGLGCLVVRNSQEKAANLRKNTLWA